MFITQNSNLAYATLTTLADYGRATDLSSRSATADYIYQSCRDSRRLCRKIEELVTVCMQGAEAH
jgi:hypothetical protein